MSGLRLGLMLAFILTSAARASDTIPWTPSNVRGWDILVDRTLKNGCFITTTFESGTVLRLGFNRNEHTAYIMVGNPEWKSIEPKKDYDLEIKFDREVPWEVTATAIIMGDVTALWAQTQKVDFLDEFVRKQGMRISYRNNEIAALSLRGTSAAVSEMVTCQNAMDGKQASNDPFKDTTTPSNDPFQ
jgi:hypothetical protein